MQAYNQYVCQSNGNRKMNASCTSLNYNLGHSYNRRDTICINADQTPDNNDCPDPDTSSSVQSGVGSFTCDQGYAANESQASCGGYNSWTCNDGAGNSTDCYAPRQCYKCNGNQCSNIPSNDGSYENSTCNNQCGYSAPYCGDGIIQTRLGESCENNTPSYGRDACVSCQNTCGPGRVFNYVQNRCVDNTTPPPEIQDFCVNPNTLKRIQTFHHPDGYIQVEETTE